MRRAILGTELAIAGTCLLSIIIFLLANPITTFLNEWFPIKTGWTVTDARIEHGTDLVITGYMYKHYDCDYLPPPGAFDLTTGEPLLVVSSSRTSGQSWPGSDRPMKFGPWTVFNGAGRIIRFYQRDKCPLWTTYTDLGSFNSITMVQISPRKSSN